MSRLTDLHRAARKAAARILGRGNASPTSPGLAPDRDYGYPFTWYEELRRTGTVHFVPQWDCWVIVGYDQVKRALAEPAVFSSRHPRMLQVDPVLIGNDAPGHTAIRRIMAHHFSAAALARRAALVERTAEDLLRPLVQGHDLDVVSGFATPLAWAVAREIIGFDAEALESFKEPTRRSQGSTDLLYDLMTGPLAAAAGRSGLYHDLRGAQGGSLDDDAARSLVKLVWIAGTVETERAVGSAVLLLLENPEVQARLGGDPGLVPRFVTEALRIRPPEHVVLRRTTAPVDIGGTTIPADASVHLCLAAANRDPAYFPDPAALRLDRPRAAHMAFGGGAHRCIGAALAHSQLTIAIRTLLQLAPRFQAVQPLADVCYAPSPPFQHIERLMIRGPGLLSK